MRPLRNNVLDQVRQAELTPREFSEAKSPATDQSNKQKRLALVVNLKTAKMLASPAILLARGRGDQMIVSGAEVQCSLLYSHFPTLFSQLI